MIIVFEDASNYLNLTKLPLNTLIISRRKLFGISRNIVIEDLRPYVGLPGILLREGFNSLAYSYITLNRQYQRVSDVLKNTDNVLLVVHGFSGFDAGSSIALVNNIIKTANKILVIIIYDPMQHIKARDKIKFYVLIKTLLLIQSLAQRLGKEVVIALIDSSRVNKRSLTAITQVLYATNKYISGAGISIIGLRRLVIPINQIKLLVKAISLKDAIREIEAGATVCLALLNKILDRAPAQFWEKARRNKDDIWPIKYVLRRVNEERNKLIESIRVMLDTLNRSEITILPDKDVLGRIVYNIIRGRSIEYIFSDEDLIMGILAKYNYLKNYQYYLVDLKGVEEGEKNYYIVYSSSLDKFIRNYMEKYFTRVPLVSVEDNDYWYTILSMRNINVFSSLLKNPLKDLLKDLEDTYYSSLNVIITVDELFPPKLVLVGKHIDIRIFSRIPVFSTEGLYEVLHELIINIESMPREMISSKINLLFRILRDLGKIISLPTYHYVDLLEKIKDMEKRISSERRNYLLRIYDLLKYVSP